MTGRAEPQAELLRWRRRAYLVLLGIGLVVGSARLALGVWTGEVLLWPIYLPLLILTGLAMVAVFVNPRWVRYIEYPLVYGIALASLARALLLRIEGTETVALLSLTAFLPLAYALAYLAGGLWRGLRDALLFYALGVIVLFVPWPAAASMVPASAVPFLMAHPLIVIALSMIAYLWEHQIRARLEAELRAELALLDPLTGLPNRRYLTEQLARAVAAAKRHGNEIALLFLDLDDFKRVNDTAGHAAGDQVLAQVAQRLLSCLRHSDTLARISGDEFVILADRLNSSEQLASLAKRILAVFELPFIARGLAFKLSVSIGISRYPAHGDAVEDLLERADAAMYRAKEAGKNTYSEAN